MFRSLFHMASISLILLTFHPPIYGVTYHYPSLVDSSKEEKEGSFDEKWLSAEVQSQQEVAQFSFFRENPDPGSGLSLAKRYFVEGKSAFDHGAYERALDLFYKSLEEDPSNTLLNHFIGRAAYELGDYEEALFAYDRALVLDPNHMLSHLEKGRTYLALGSKEEAREAFHQVLDFQIPWEIRENVNRTLAKMDYVPKNFFNGALIVAHTWDSNATLGTGSVPLPQGVNVFSNPTEQSDQIATVTLMGNHQQVIDEKLSWRNGLLFHLSDNKKVDSNDLLMISPSTGIQGIWGRHTFDCTFVYMWLQVNEELYQANQRWAVAYKKCCENWFWKSGFQLTKRHHYAVEAPGVETTDGLVLQGNLGFSWIPNSCNQVDGDVVYRYDRYPDDAADCLSFDRLAAHFTYTRELGYHLDLELGANYRHDQYNDVHAVYTDRRRKDDAYWLTVGLVRKFGTHNLFKISGEYLNNHSNIPINDYDSWKGSVSFTRIFS